MYDHVVLVSIDTLRADGIEAAPTDLMTPKYALSIRPDTPVLNRYATEGAYFSKVITAAPYTSTSHASFFSGYWPLRHGLYEFYNRRLSRTTLFDRARSRGYSTIFKTDFPLILGQELGFTDAIDHYVIEDDDLVLRQIRDAEKSVSFVHFGGAHLPYGFHNLKYGGSAYRDKVDELGRQIGGFDNAPVDQVMETYRNREDRHFLICYKAAVEHFYRSAAYDKLMALYVEGINFFMRTRLDPFLENLEAILKDRNCLIVIFGDHGEEYDEHSRGHFDSLNEGVVRVPMIFRGRDVVPNQWNEPVCSVDLAPTLYARLGWEEPGDDLDGHSLADTIFGGSPAQTGRPAFAQTYVAGTAQFMILQKDMLEKNQPRRPLRHVLYKEAVWQGPARLVQQHHRHENRKMLSGLYPCNPIAVSEIEVMPGVYRPAPEKTSELSGLLAAYNRNRTGLSPERPDTSRVRQWLADTGYHI